MRKIKKIASYLLASLVSVSTAFAVISTGEVSADADRRIIVSLGDSYSSGEGTEPFYGQEENWDEKKRNFDWLAHRSTLSWPGRLELKDKYGNNIKMSDSRNINWFFAAASGAEIKHLNNDFKKTTKKYNLKELSTLLIQQETYTDYIPPQLDIFDNIEIGKVDYVTMTMAGNDIGFANIVTDEVVNSLKDYHFGIDLVINCNKAKSAINVNKYNATLEKKYNNFDSSIGSDLKFAYKEIQNKAGEQAKIIVAGYPQLLDESGNSFFTSEACKQINEYASKFNAKIESAVNECRINRNINTFFVSVEDAFKDNRAYSKKEWINRIKFVKAQDICQSDIISAYSIHPNEEGTKAYAGEVQKKLDLLDSTGIVSGRIYGAVYSNVKLNFFNKTLGTFSQVKSDENGYYEYYGSPGEYQIEVISENEQVLINDLATGKPAVIKLELREFKRDVDINIDNQLLIGTNDSEKIITMGGYKWRILNENADSMLVISENMLEARAYDSFENEVTWENSEIRRYLNDEFYNRFSAEEKMKIVNTHVENTKSSKWDISGGNDTNDYIFLLSEDEALKYFNSDIDRLAKYDKSQRQIYGERYLWWWLRSPGMSSKEALFVNSDGSISECGYNTHCDFVGIRPAMVLSKPSVKIDVPENTPDGCLISLKPIRDGDEIKVDVIFTAVGEDVSYDTICLAYYFNSKLRLEKGSGDPSREECLVEYKKHPELEKEYNFEEFYKALSVKFGASDDNDFVVVLNSYGSVQTIKSGDSKVFASLWFKGSEEDYNSIGLKWKDEEDYAFWFANSSISEEQRPHSYAVFDY